MSERVRGILNPLVPKLNLGTSTDRSMSGWLRAVLEGLVIVLGLLSFWPWILGQQGWWYKCGTLFVAVLLVVVAVASFRRVRRALENGRSLRSGTGPSADEKTAFEGRGNPSEHL